MHPNCHTCNHPKRAEIDLALVAGTSSRQVAIRYNLSHDSVGRHRASHLPGDLLRCREAEDIARSEALLAAVHTLQERTLAILRRVEERGEVRGVMAAVREVRRNLELLSRLQTRTGTHPLPDLWRSPEWIAVRSALREALAPFPEARYAAAERLLALEPNHDSHV